jgi:hypothetical protein
VPASFFRGSLLLVQERQEVAFLITAIKNVSRLHDDQRAPDPLAIVVRGTREYERPLGGFGIPVQIADCDDAWGGGCATLRGVGGGTFVSRRGGYRLRRVCEGRGLRSGGRRILAFIAGR